MPEKSVHSFVSELRQNIKINGVEDVISFDEGEVVLQTSCGGMTLEGEGLHIGVLSVEQGVVEVDGRIDGVYYFDNTLQKKKHFGKR